MMELSRRTVLKGLAGTALATVAGSAARTLADPGLAAADTPFLRAGSLPFPNLPVGYDSLPQIEHLVYFMMENHSFDNYFGMLGRGDGFTLGPDGLPVNSVPTWKGGRVQAYHAGSACTAHYNIGQDWVRSHLAWDHGRNDGFLAETNLTHAMAYFDAGDIPFYYSLGRTFPVCDRYFCSTMGQTDPNRKFMIAATANGQVNDSGSLVDILSTPSPANGTIFDLLSAHNISWKDYFVTLPTSAGLYPSVGKNHPLNLASIGEFLVDAAAGTLPAVSYVDPDGWQGSEENPQDIQTGEFFSQMVIQAVLHGAAWDKTLMLFTYDEHGGYYDHVPPVPMVPPDGVKPQAPNGETFGDLYTWSGFRVPAVVISPWAKSDYVSHVVYDHTSFLRLIETKWNLPALTNRDANANNLLDTVDFSRPSFEKPPALAAATVPVGELSCYLQNPDSPLP
jgi:phospholipase C